MAKSLWLVTLVLLLAACRPSSSASNPAILPFNESFMDNRNNWGENDSDLSSRKIDKGALLLHVKKAKQSSWATSPYIFPADVAAQADITLPNAAETINWAAGVGVRSDGLGNESSYYVCAVNAVGDWFFMVRTAKDTWKTLRKGKIGSRVDAQKPNTIRCSANGEEYTFTFNGKELVRLKDKTLPSDGNPKYVILYTESYAQPNIVVEFRNFQVMRAGK